LQKFNSSAQLGRLSVRDAETLSAPSLSRSFLSSPVLRKNSKNSSLVTYNPSEVIKALQKQVYRAELRNAPAEEIETLQEQIVEERRELMKIYKHLMTERQRRQELTDEDQLVNELIGAARVHELHQHIPRQPLELIESEIFLATISGPNLNENVRSYKDHLSAISTSTYPFVSGGDTRAGDPICDFYYVRLFERGTLFALSDGCNWGKEAQQAAQRAATCFVKYLQARLFRLSNTRQVTKEILRAFAACHSAIMEGKEQSEFFRIGTATLTGGALLPLFETPKGEKKSSPTLVLRRSDVKEKKARGASEPLSTYSAVETNSLPRPIPVPTPTLDVVKPLQRSKRKKSQPKRSPRRHSGNCSPVNTRRETDEVEPTTPVTTTPPATPPEPTVLVDTVAKGKTSSPSRKPRRKHKSSHSVTEQTVMKVKAVNRHRSITHYGMYNVNLKQENSLDSGEDAPEIDQQHDWAFVFGSVGDCKVFLYNPSTASVTDISSVNRTQSLNAADCGGRLGPCDKQGKPDLRNLFVASATVRQGDLILVVSDGMHDNLDPELLGKFPSDLDESIDEGTSWKELPAPLMARIKTRYREDTLASLINHTLTTPQDICQALVEYSRKVTYASRSFMEQRPSEELPEDYTLYPGKMDHTSCICLSVCSRENVSDSNMVRDAFVRKDVFSVLTQSS